jgi:hypothetical protein
VLLDPIFSQNNADYFPYKTGDMWEYTLYDVPLDTIQSIVINDSVDESGNIYATFFARNIGPIEPPQFGFWDTTKYEIDRNLNVFGFDYFSHTWANLYRLNGNADDQWVMFGGNGEYVMARIEWIIDTLLLGENRKLMSICYYATPDSTDTTGLDWYGDMLLKGFGLYRRGSAEAPQFIYLHGAVIDGILYGDTTNVITSVNENINDLNSTSDFTLLQNYPNPFNSSTKIPFKLNIEGIISLTIYDLLGKEVVNLVNQQFYHSGYYEFNWDGKDAASGIYFYTFTSGNFMATKKLILLK